MQGCPRPPLMCRTCVRKDLQKQSRRSCGNTLWLLDLRNFHPKSRILPVDDLVGPVHLHYVEGRAEMLPWGQSHDKPGSEVDSNNYFYRTGPPSAPLETPVPDFCHFKREENRDNEQFSISENPRRVWTLEWDPAHG